MNSGTTATPLFPDFSRVEAEVNATTINAVRGGAGPPLLLLHGYPQTHVMWHRVAPVLAERFTVVCPDLRGYGDSGKPRSDERHQPYSKRVMAQDQLELMGALGFPKPMARLSHRAIPATSILVVGTIAGGGLLLAHLRGWGAEAFLIVPNSLVIVVYIVGMAAGVRLLAGPARLLAAVAALLCLAIVPFVGGSLLLPAAVAVAALSYRVWRRRRAPRELS